MGRDTYVKSKMPKIKKRIHIKVGENINETLYDDGYTIHKLYHIYDIHISRFDNRHSEFMLVFERVSDMRHDVATDTIINNY